MNVPLYHYTTGNKLAPIMASGKLQPSAAPPWSPNERPVLWFSSSAIYEFSALKAIMKPDGERVFSFSELSRVAGICRFVLHGGAGMLAMQRWPHVAKRAGMSYPESLRLAAAGINMGANPDDWYGTFQECPLETVTFDWLTPCGWESMTLSDGLAHFEALGTVVASFSAHQQRITEVTQ